MLTDVGMGMVILRRWILRGRRSGCVLLGFWLRFLRLKLYFLSVCFINAAYMTGCCMEVRTVLRAQKAREGLASCAICVIR